MWPMQRLVLLVCLMLVVRGSFGAGSMTLGGEWELYQGERAAIPCTIPGDNYSALLKAGMMVDPFVGTNEWAVQHFADEDVRLVKEFDVPNYWVWTNANEAVQLEFGGLSPAAEIDFNGKKFEADNQFRWWRFDVTGLLKEKGNRLEVKIRSPRKESVRRNEAYGRGADVMSFGCGTMKYVNFMRQTQCQAGWDWGVSLPSVGILEGVRLRRARTAFVNYVWTRQELTKDLAHLTVVAELEPTERAKAGDEVKVGFKLDGQKKEAVGKVPRDCGAFQVEATFEIVKPKLWWPYRYGIPNLYAYDVWTDEGEFTTGKVGLRTVEVVREKDADGAGESFYFRVNGVKVFVKGWNWIPTEAFATRRTAERTEMLLKSAQVANANMIRVWGGGVYESYHFYRMCDELGLMVWQDMMFACGEYPADSAAFRKNVQEEVTHQVKKLRGHPSIVMWCGDNELYWCTWQTPKWISLCDRLTMAVGDAVRAADESREFWPSSPCAGDRSWGDDVFDGAKGDSHCWAGEEREDGKTAECFLKRRVRFMSEYGWCSYPAADYLKRSVGTIDLDSAEMMNHVKKPVLAKDVRRAVAAYLGEAKDDAAEIYLSQVLQARVLRKAQNRLHAQMPYCMGVLDWQLNDWWPALSWSKIDGELNWKAAMYAAEKYNAPLVVGLDSAASSETGGVVTVMWDLPEALVRGEVGVKVREILTGKIVDEKSYAFEFDGPSVKTFGEAWARDDAHYLELSVKGTTARGAVHVNDVTEFLSPIAETILPEAGLRVKSAAVEDMGVWMGKRRVRQAKVVVENKAPAFGVMLSVKGVSGVVWNPNFVTLAPGEHTFMCALPDGVSAADFTQNLKVEDLASARKVKETK